ncbi:MAG: ATP-binding protein [Armatimonadota bacterium]
MDDVKRLQEEFERLKLVVEDLEHKKRQLEEQIKAARTMSDVPAAIVSRPDLQNVLGRLVKKVAMILQGEKCVIMLFDPEVGELQVLPPALGLNEEQVRAFRVKDTEGVTGHVFRTGESVIFHDAVRDERTIKDHVAFLQVRNGLTVALTTKRKDEDERVLEERRIGVMHVFNKRFGQEFNEDDQRLLEMLADQAAAVIANAQLYIQVVEEKKRLEDTLESIHSGVLVVDEEGEIVLLNDAARRIFAVSDGEGLGAQMAEALADAEVVELLRDSLSSGEELSREVTVQAASDRIFQAQTSLMKNEEGQLVHVVAIFNDITEIRNIERMKTAFVSTVSHELRTPLTSIKGFIATLLEDKRGYYDEETKQEFYAIIDAECERLHRLIQDLLNIARIEEGHVLDLHLGTVDVPEMASRICAAHQSYTSKHDLICQFPSDFPEIVADADRVHQIMENLVSNAVKYSPEGGEVWVRGSADTDSALIEVQDQGQGIPRRNWERIFQRFHRGEDENDTHVPGTGIGLYLVRYLAEAHGGEVRVLDSEVGKGTTFGVRLPIQPPDHVLRAAR